MMLDRIDALSAQINNFTTAIEQAIVPLAAQVDQLDQIPGIGLTAARAPCSARSDEAAGRACWVYSICWA